MPLDLRLDDVLRLRKPHPCGGYEWRVVRLGADIGLVCTTCGPPGAPAPRGGGERTNDTGARRAGGVGGAPGGGSRAAPTAHIGLSHAPALADDPMGNLSVLDRMVNHSRE